MLLTRSGSRRIQLHSSTQTLCSHLHLTNQEMEAPQGRGLTCPELMFLIPTPILFPCAPWCGKTPHTHIAHTHYTHITHHTHHTHHTHTSPPTHTSHTEARKRQDLQIRTVRCSRGPVKLYARPRGGPVSNNCGTPADLAPSPTHTCQGKPWTSSLTTLCSHMIKSSLTGVAFKVLPSTAQICSPFSHSGPTGASAACGGGIGHSCESPMVPPHTAHSRAGEADPQTGPDDTAPSNGGGPLSPSAYCRKAPGQRAELPYLPPSSWSPCGDMEESLSRWSKAGRGPEPCQGGRVFPTEGSSQVRQSVWGRAAAFGAAERRQAQQMTTEVTVPLLCVTSHSPICGG